MLLFRDNQTSLLGIDRALKNKYFRQNSSIRKEEGECKQQQIVNCTGKQLLQNNNHNNRMTVLHVTKQSQYVL